MSKNDLSTGNVYYDYLDVCFYGYCYNCFFHMLATIQAEFVLVELSKDELSTANVYDSALPWLTVPERCAFMVMVMIFFFIYFGLGSII